MSNSPTPEELDLARAVITHSELKSIEVYEVSARRVDLREEFSKKGNVAFDVQQRLGASDFGIKINARVQLEVGEASASVAGEYSVSDDFEVSREALRVFANEVAIMTIFPYLREALAGVTAKVFGKPLSLPILERGQISLNPDAVSK